jgi:hypothetical protein
MKFAGLLSRLRLTVAFSVRILDPHRGTLTNEKCTTGSVVREYLSLAFTPPQAARWLHAGTTTGDVASFSMTTLTLQVRHADVSLNRACCSGWVSLVEKLNKMRSEPTVDVHVFAAEAGFRRKVSISIFVQSVRVLFAAFVLVLLARGRFSGMRNRGPPFSRDFQHLSI